MSTEKRIPGRNPASKLWPDFNPNVIQVELAGPKRNLANRIDPPTPPPSAKSWGVWCVVSGGVTGHREAWAKSDGSILRFASEDEAIALARKWASNVSPYATASFRYTARRFDDGGSA